MLDNPIFNPTPNTGVKGNNPGLKTLEYQLVKVFRTVVKGAELVFRSLFQILKDMFKQVVRPS